MTMTLNCCCCTRSRKKKTYKKKPAGLNSWSFQALLQFVVSQDRITLEYSKLE